MWKADPDEIIAAVNRGHQTLASTHRRRAAIWKVADLVFHTLLQVSSYYDNVYFCHDMSINMRL